MDNSNGKRQREIPISEIQAGSEGVALQMSAYFGALVRDGFTREEAIQLTLAYQSTLFMGLIATQQQKRDDASA